MGTLYPVFGLASTQIGPPTCGTMRKVRNQEKKDFESPLPKRLGELLRRLMAESDDCKSSQAMEAKIKSISRVANVGRSTINRATRGENAVGIDVLESIAAALGFRPWELLKRMDDIGSARPELHAWVSPISSKQRALVHTTQQLAGKLPDPVAESMTRMIHATIAAAADADVKRPVLPEINLEGSQLKAKRPLKGSA